MNNKKILILGSKGMLGTDLQRVFEGYDVTAWDKDSLDITDRVQVLKFIKKLNPYVVINAAAYTDVDKAESEVMKADDMNSIALLNLSEACKQIDATLVHYSTDYVFNGRKITGYKENDLFSPINQYGRTKANGEITIHHSGIGKYYIIRSSWLFGPSLDNYHKNFVNTILRLALNRPKIKVVCDQFGSPTYTLDLAKRTKDILFGYLPFGTYHFTNKGTTTWYKFAKEIMKVVIKKHILRPGYPKIVPCLTKDYIFPEKTIAPRPRYSILRDTKTFKAGLSSNVRSWKDALDDYINNIK